MIEIAPLDLEAHLDEVLALQRAAYAVEAEIIGTDAIPTLHETREQLAACGERWLAASLINGPGPLIKGAVSYTRDGDLVDICRLIVHPDAFRQGIASRLLDALEERESDARRWIVMTGAANAPALSLYAARGFAVTGEQVRGGVRIASLERDT